MIVVFDLDDTLYPEYDFVCSGFRHVSNYLESTYGIEPKLTYSFMLDLYNREGSGDIFNKLKEEYKINFPIDTLVQEYRFHKPAIKLPLESIEVLNRLKKKGVRLGLITDGTSETQKNKYEALRLSEYIDHPLFTADLKTSKPDKLPFEKQMQYFAEESEFWYIGDNPVKDFIAPSELNWKFVRIKLDNGVYRDRIFKGKWEVAKLTEIFQFLNL